MPRAKATKEPTFEQAFEELREVVEQLEAGDLPLERSLALFERGQALAGRCAELLDTAELRVKTLTGENLTIGENEEEDR
jgi:exodeoxyribonuclease VII small subunit